MELLSFWDEVVTEKFIDDLEGGDCLMKIQYNINCPEFTGRNVPITEIVKEIGKDAQYIRLGVQQGILKFGIAMKMKDFFDYSYYCSDKKFGKKQAILIKISQI